MLTMKRNEDLVDLHQKLETNKKQYKPTNLNIYKYK